MWRETNNKQDEKINKWAPTTEQVIEKVCKVKNELLKLSLNDSLKKWINIINETQYKRWVKLLKEHNIIDLSNTSFSDISKDWLSFAIKRINDDEYITVFSTYSLLWMNPNGPFSKWGIVHDGWKFEKVLDTWISHQTNSDWIKLLDLEEKKSGACDTDSKKEKSNTQKKSIRTPAVYSKEPAKWVKSEPKQTPKTTESLLPTLDTIYTVKRWDSLWNITKTFYPHADNRELANIINALVRYNKIQSKLLTLDNKPPQWDWIKWDTIIIWKTILIPTELKVLWKTINRFE